MNYWLHRIKGGDHAYEYAWPLLFDHNWLSIGWSDFSQETFLTDVREKGCIEAIDGWIEEKWGDRPKNCRNRWNLYRFFARDEARRLGVGAHGWRVQRV